MPAAVIDGEAKNADTYCARCQTAKSTLIVRTEHLCNECFMKYISTKVLKRLESNKIRGAFQGPLKTLLVPISFGVSSICLLQILDYHLQVRKDQGRHAGYSLHVLFVDQSTTLEQDFPQELRGLIMERYPSHVYSTVSLGERAEYEVPADESQNSQWKDLEHVVRSLPSASARTDFVEMTRRRLIVAFAGRHNCDATLFGDSTTRLAERTLSETAKGRGISLPWLTADGDSSGIHCIYPLRDLLRKELVAYANVMSPPLTPLISDSSRKVNASSKDMTIDGLMTQYFESVEKDYPSIVANVVRTTGKLRAPASSDGGDACSLCRCPVIEVAWGGEQGSAALSPADLINGTGYGQPLCYGCKTTLLKG